MNPSRRLFIKSVAALAAAAVSPSFLKLPQSDIERLLVGMRSGLVEDQTFFFTKPITIAFNNLVIRRCKFVFRFAEPQPCAIIVSGHHITMDTISVDCGGARTGLIIEQTKIV